MHAGAARRKRQRRQGLHCRVRPQASSVHPQRAPVLTLPARTHPSSPPSLSLGFGLGPVQATHERARGDRTAAAAAAAGAAWRPWLARRSRSFSAIRWFHSMSSATSFSRSALTTTSDAATTTRRQSACMHVSLRGAGWGGVGDPPAPEPAAVVSIDSRSSRSTASSCCRRTMCASDM
jgi:hypothetical protein